MIPIPREYCAYEICYGCSCHERRPHPHFFVENYEAACARARGKYAALVKGGHINAWVLVSDAGNLCLFLPGDEADAAPG